MKKFTAILLTVIMVASLFVSCNDSIAPTVTDETVSVSFTEAASRSLTASLEQFEKDKLYWKYAARKNTADGTGLNSGATVFYDEASALWIKGDTSSDDNKGLGSVAGFSQGIWDFKLFAYKKVGTAAKLAYQGEVTGVSLKKGSANTVSVTVSPVAGDKGTLVLADTISLAPAKEGDTPSTDLAKVYTVTALGGTAAISPDKNQTKQWTLDAGAYKVNVDFVKDGFTYASGSVVATVYSNITTTVAGNLAELVTKAEFDSSINPDVMNKEASSGSVDFGTSTQTDIILKDATAIEASTVVAKVPADAASQIINTVVGSASSTKNTIDLALRVDTVSATNTSLELEIGMQATIVQYDAANKVINQTTQKVTELKNSDQQSVISEVTIKLQPGLRNVVVKHNGITMTESATAGDQLYSYDATTGTLKIWTSSFSPFTVTYDAPVYVAKVGEKKYASLGGALNDAANGSTVVVLKDISGPITVNTGKNITLDLNGYSITANGTAIINNGTLTIKDSGTNGKVQSNGNVAIAAGDGSTTTIESGNYIAQEMAVLFDATGATININGGTFTARDNAVIAGNGTRRDGDANTININGGTFNGGIITSGYVACGIYAPWKDVINVFGGTFNITGGAGIVARAGNVIVSGGTFNCTGNAKGKVGDSRVVVPCSALVFDSEANYPAMTPESKITVTGGTFTSEVAAIATVPDTAVGRIKITAGIFSSDTSAYVVKLNSGAKTELNTGFPDSAVVIRDQATLDASLRSAAGNVTNTLYIGAGTFNIDNVDCRNKTIEFVGSGYDKTILKYGTQPFSNGGEQGSCYSFEGANVTFKDVTLQDKNGDDLNYKGFVRSNGLTFENCVLKSRMTYLGENGTVSFTNCTFNTPKYAAWIYSSQTYNFVNCLFESPKGRFLNIYSENNINPVINATNCMFKDTSDGKDSNAVFNIKSSAETTLRIEDCLVTGASPMYKVANDNTTVIVDGITVYGTAN